MIYNRYDPAQRYTEFYSKDLTLKINYTEGYNSVSKLTEMNSIRFVAELKVPGHAQLQMCYSTLDVLLLMKKSGETSFERYNLEKSTDDYLRVIRREICESLPGIISKDNYHQITGEWESSDKVSAGGLKWSVLSPKDGNTFVILSGIRLYECNNILKRFAERYEILKTLLTNNGFVMEIPYVASHTLAHAELLSCIVKSKEMTGKADSVRTVADDVSGKVLIIKSNGMATLDLHGRKFDATELVSGLKKTGINVLQAPESFFKDLLRGQKVDLGNNKEGIMVKSLWGYKLRCRETINETINEQQNEL